MTPQATAVCLDGGKESLTYAQLDARACHLARQLHRMGVKPETLVVVCMERSLEMVVGILGVLKAGGAYIPIEPSYPSERIAYMVADSKSAIILTQSHLLPRLNVGGLCNIYLGIHGASERHCGGPFPNNQSFGMDVGALSF